LALKNRKLKPFVVSCLFVLAIVFGLTSGAWALGPFSHLKYARVIWPDVARQTGLDALDENLWRVFQAGALAPDAGYYLEQQNGLAQVAHQLAPWRFCRLLLKHAHTDSDRAFALGWLSHCLLDLKGHSQIVNPVVGGGYSKNNLLHKQVEWGLDCYLLAKPENQWLWEVKPDPLAGLDPWANTVLHVHGKKPPLNLLKQAFLAEFYEVGRLPYVFWMSGSLRLEDRSLLNCLGFVLGNTLRPGYAAWLTWRDGDQNVLAVLTPRPPSEDSLKEWEKILNQGPRDILALLKGQPWPMGNLDMDKRCAKGDCPEALEAKAWLKSLP
jgi:hypothetical protein